MKNFNLLFLSPIVLSLATLATIRVVWFAAGAPWIAPDIAAFVSLIIGLFLGLFVVGLVVDSGKKLTWNDLAKGNDND